MRDRIDQFNRKFEELGSRWSSIVGSLPDPAFSHAVNTDDKRAQGRVALVLRSAAMIEMVFGGLTTRMWDDPFEWTLPEAMNSRDKAEQYLAEVSATREFGMGFFNDDRDLSRSTPSPVELRTIDEILTGAIRDAEHILEQVDVPFAAGDRSEPQTL